MFKKIISKNIENTNSFLEWSKEEVAFGLFREDPLYKACGRTIRKECRANGQSEPDDMENTAQQRFWPILNPLFIKQVQDVQISELEPHFRLIFKKHPGIKQAVITGERKIFEDRIKETAEEKTVSFDPGAFFYALSGEPEKLEKAAEKGQIFSSIVNNKSGLAKKIVDNFMQNMLKDDFEADKKLSGKLIIDLYKDISNFLFIVEILYKITEQNPACLWINISKRSIEGIEFYLLTKKNKSIYIGKIPLAEKQAQRGSSGGKRIKDILGFLISYKQENGSANKVFDLF